MHRQVFARPDSFLRRSHPGPRIYPRHDGHGGTLGNVAALWCARNRCLGPKAGFAGVEQEGLAAALQAYGAKRAVVIGSSLMHYPCAKRWGFGFGERNLIGLRPDRQGRLDPCRWPTPSRRARPLGDQVIAIIGIAGTTETGAVDPLIELAQLAADYAVHLHVDAAWGGPTLFFNAMGIC